MKTLTTKPTSSTPSAGVGRGVARAVAARHAFTRLELCAGLAAVALLGLLALPALASNRSRGDIAHCLNNLRLIGRAVEMFAGDHVGQPQWRTYTSDGGTRPITGTKPGAAWFEFTALSNELATPRILACPADTGVKVAAEFSNSGAGGYLSTGFRSAATSYLINLDNPFNSPLNPLAADRNWRTDGLANCGNGINNADALFRYGNSGWTNGVHGLAGHVLRADGRVTLLDTAGSRAAVLPLIDDNGSAHLLRAR